MVNPDHSWVSTNSSYRYWVSATNLFQLPKKTVSMKTFMVLDNERMLQCSWSKNTRNKQTNKPKNWMKQLSFEGAYPWLKMSWYSHLINTEFGIQATCCQKCCIFFAKIWTCYFKLQAIFLGVLTPPSHQFWSTFQCFCHIRDAWLLSFAESQVLRVLNGGKR